MNFKIYVGSRTSPSYYFEKEDSFSAKVTQKVALAGKELTVDTFEPEVQDDINDLTDSLHFRSSDGMEIEDIVGQLFVIDIDTNIRESDLINLEYGTPIWYYWGNNLIGKFYVSNVDRTAKNKYLLHCVSAIGLLDKMEHGGGLFTASTFQTVLDHILAEGLHGTGDPVIDYTIDPDVADMSVSGYLPKDTKRNNLYRLMFAYGVNIIKNPDGDPMFTFIFTAAQNPTSIDDEEIYNTGSRSYEKPYSKVGVTEHTYTAIRTEDAVTLFDNTDSGSAVTNEEVWFTSAPIIVDTIESVEGSLTFTSAGVNSAIVSGTGKLIGVPYTHTTRTITSELESGDREKTARADNCTMVNIVNSENLLARLKAYYQPDGLIRTIKNSIVYTNQRCGKAYKFLSPFDEDTTAYLTSMNINASEVFKADCEWRENYSPAGQSGLYLNGYERFVPYYDESKKRMIYDGTWTVPDGVTEFKVVLIGGGTGGSSGYPGENGDDAYSHTDIATTEDLSGVWYGAEGGEGGAGGSGGSPGRVKIFTVENAKPGQVYNWHIGTGGAGGAATGFIPDTASELKRALANEDPDTTYTDAQIAELVEKEEALSGWTGNPNAGTEGGLTYFLYIDLHLNHKWWRTTDDDSYVPTGGVYDPIGNEYYALPGGTGIPGGKGGARKVESGSTFNWVTDGEDVQDDDGNVYYGGNTGEILVNMKGSGSWMQRLSEADGKLKAYGGNGAGAAVGVDRANNEHINGASDQTTSWNVTYSA